MTIRHIRTFYEVCVRGGITRAAESLCVAQPSVSQTISELESYYGVKLFERVGRRLVLTPEGEKLRTKAADVLAQFDEFEAAAASAAAKPTVRIGASITVGKIVVPGLMNAIHEQICGVECVAVIDSTAAVQNEILNGGLDFALVEGRISGDLVAEEWAGDRLAAVCAPSAPFAGCADGAGLTHMPLLLRLRGSASRDLLDARLAERGLAANPVIQSSSNSALIAAAQGGCGVAVLPFALVRDGISCGSLREIALPGLDLSRTWFIIFRRDKKFNAVQSAALGICRSLRH